MKALLMIATLITSTLATANTEFAATPGLLNFSVVNADFSPNHVTNPGYATLTLNYNEGNVTLFVQQKNNCPPNAMCILSMPAPVIVELPIVSITVDGCGTKTVTAKEDQRPVDGALEVITVKDVSHNICHYNFKPSATYKSVYVNRMTGNDIVITSTMGLEPLMTVLAE